MNKTINLASKFKRPKSLTELVADELRREIIEGDLDLGASLSEARIAARLGVSRTPVREALHRLDLEGLVTTKPQRGTYVFTIDVKNLTNICDVRITLETAALRLATHHDPAGLASSLDTIAKKMSSAREEKDDREYLRLDTEFHQAFFEHTGNDYLLEAYQTIVSKMAALRHRLGGNEDHIERSYKQHLQIVTAVKKGDLKILESILEKHIGDKKGSYWRADNNDLLAPKNI